MHAFFMLKSKVGVYMFPSENRQELLVQDFAKSLKQANLKIKVTSKNLLGRIAKR
jgi:hypothetical protein